MPDSCTTSMRAGPPGEFGGDRSGRRAFGLQFGKALAQLALTLPALGHVAEDGSDSEDGARLVAYHDDVELQRDTRAVLSHGGHGQHLGAVLRDAGVHHAEV